MKTTTDPREVSPSYQDATSSITKLDTNDEESDPFTSKERYLRFIATWKGTATLCIAASSFTCMLNLIVLSWALAARPKEDGFVITFAIQDYVAVTVDRSFSQGIPWTISRQLPLLNEFRSTVLEEIAKELQYNFSQNTLTRLDVDHCQNIYESQFQSRWGNLVAVSSVVNTTQVNGTLQTTIAALTPAWVASPAVTGNYQWWNSTQFAGQADNVLRPPTNVSLYAWAANCALNDQESCAFTDTYTRVEIEACYVQETTEKSTLSLSIGFLSFTIGANLIKALTPLFVINKPGFRPLSTTREAISSFLVDPDIYTAGMGPASVDEIRTGPMSPTWHGFTFNANKQHRSWKAATSVRWWLGVLSLLVPFLCGLVCLYWASAWHNIPTTGNTRTVFTGLQSFQTPAVYSVAKNFTGTALAVNAIQIGLAWSYLAASDLLTSMVASREYQRYAETRKAVPVARPKGQQRGTYFLSLPWKFSLPLITLWALLHWQISIELELVKVNVYTSDGVLDKARGYQGMVISSYWFSGIVSGVFLLFIGIMVLSYRKYRCGMPLTRSNSLLISAACHRGPEEGPEATTLPVKYGVLPGVANDGFECVGFSSRHVEPLIAGRRYSSYIDVNANMPVNGDRKECI